MKLEGVVGACELADIFHLLSSTARCGVLVVSQGAARRKLYFGPEGVTLFWDSSRAGHLLGQILRARGVIDQKVLKVALDQQTATGLPLGQILCNSGAARPEQVEEALAYQLREELFHVLCWEKAHFEFHEGASHPIDPGRSYSRTPSFNTDAIIMEAARRADEWQRIRQVITSEHAVPLKVSPDVTPTGEPVESKVARAVLGLADGTCSLQRMVETLRRSEFDVYECVYTLVGAGVLKLASANELANLAAQAITSNDIAPARGLLVNAAALCADDLTLRYDIGTMLLGVGDEDEARKNLDVILRHLVDRGLTGKIDEMLDNLRDEFPDAPYSYERQLKLLDRSKDFALALPLAVRLLELYDRRGDTQTAVHMLRHLSGFTVSGTQDLLRLAEMLEAHGGRSSAARKYCLAADQLRYAGRRRDAVQLYRKALRLDDQLTAARKELNCLLGRSGRRLARLSLGVVVILTALAAGAGGFFLLYREHVARDALKQTRDVATGLLSAKDYEGALRAYGDVLTAHPNTLVAGNVREQIDKIERLQRQHLEARRADERRLFLGAEQAERELDLERALTEYERLTAGTLTDDLAQEARERLHRLRTEMEEYRRLLKDARSREATGQYAEAVRSYLAARMSSPRLFNHDQVKLPLLVESSPPGAQVLHDDKPIGTTPLVVHLRPDESWQLGFRHPGFNDTSAAFSARGDEPVPRVRLTPRRPPLWTFRGEGVIDQPIRIIGNTCYVSARQGRVYALSLHTGTSLWEARLDTTAGEYLSAPVVAGDRVIVSMMDGSIVALAPDTGAELWRRNGHGLLAGPPIHLASEKLVVLVYPDGTLHYVEPVKGETVRRSELPRAPLGSMLTIGDMLYYGTDDHAVQAVDLRTGSVGWKWRPGRPVTQPMKHSGEYLCVPLQDLGLAAAPLSSGERLWRFAGSGEPVRASATNAECVFTAEAQGHLTALNIRTGSVLWQACLDAGDAAGMEADGGHVYVATSEGRFCVLRASDGVVLWKTDLAGPAASQPVLAGDRVLVTTTTGAVHAFAR